MKLPTNGLNLGLVNVVIGITQMDATFMKSCFFGTLVIWFCAIVSSAQTITLKLLPVSQVDRNYRVGGMAGFSVAYVSDQYRVYATTSLMRGRWIDNTSIDDYFLESLTVGSEVYRKDADKCWSSSSGYYDPRLWNARCIDTIGLLTKRIECNENPNYACQSNDLWNAYPGRSNMSTFPTRPPLDDSGFGWPSNQSWGVKNFAAIVTKDTVNQAQLSPTSPAAPPPPSPALPCVAHNVGPYATGVANSKVTQVKFADGTTRWFMAYNSQIHKEWGGTPSGFTGDDLWRLQWAYSSDGQHWTAENRSLLMDSTETLGWCATGELATDMFADINPLDNKTYFYIVITRPTLDQVWLLRSPVVESSIPGYDTSLGWEVRGGLNASGKNIWVRIPPQKLGTQIDFTGIGAESILPTRFGGAYPGLVKQSGIARVFASLLPNSPSKYLALTVDANGTAPAVIELWATDDLSSPFLYQSDVAFSPAGGYGFEFSFVHYADNSPATPRVFDNNFELWFVTDTRCEGLPNCSILPVDQRPAGTSSPPQYRNQSAFTVARRRATLSGSIYGP
ncbi:MAG TPA: hypothetical protein VLL54_02320 [Pyrinomonadaceae bacterium]|nr:hypothetical protein [Pyrinomonadaceae bacterium]